MPRVFHFEIHADDPERARKFYGDVFGWKFAQWLGREYWHISTGDYDDPGIDGELAARTIPGYGTIMMIDVSSVDEFIRRIMAHGGELVRRTTTPGAGYLAYCRDTEGNIISILEYNASAQ